jgi:hypothetical protein
VGERRAVNWGGAGMWTLAASRVICYVSRGLKFEARLALARLNDGDATSSPSVPNAFAPTTRLNVKRRPALADTLQPSSPMAGTGTGFSAVLCRQAVRYPILVVNITHHHPARELGPSPQLQALLLQQKVALHKQPLRRARNAI